MTARRRRLVASRLYKKAQRAANARASRMLDKMLLIEPDGAVRPGKLGKIEGMHVLSGPDQAAALHGDHAHDRVLKPAEDTWKHRAAHMRCMTCMSFVHKAGEIGRCRRRAPTYDGWPVVRLSDWCMEHRIDETKV